MRVISEADGLHKPGAMFLLCAQMVAVNSLSLGNFYRPFCTLPLPGAPGFTSDPAVYSPLLYTCAFSHRFREVTRT